jgi:hypothetical protein
MGDTSGAGTVYPKEAHEFTPGFCKKRPTQTYIQCEASKNSLKIPKG